jgi:hypothetical protein
MSNVFFLSNLNMGDLFLVSWKKDSVQRVRVVSTKIYTYVDDQQGEAGSMYSTNLFLNTGWGGESWTKTVFFTL